METKIKSHERNINDKTFKKLRVLLIGKEFITATVRDTLREVGHDVITRESIEDAKEVYEKELKKFDVVYHMVEVIPEEEAVEEVVEDKIEVPTIEEEEESDVKEDNEEGNDNTTA